MTRKRHNRAHLIQPLRSGCNPRASWPPLPSLGP